MSHRPPRKSVAIVAVPDTAGSALYGMVDVLSATGNLWESLVRSGTGRAVFDVRIVAASHAPFDCGNRVPVRPDAAVGDDPAAEIVILPELWLGPDEPLRDRYPDVMAWLRRRHARGAWLYSACSGAVMLAESGLLDGCDATSHWGYEDLFRTCYPAVRFRPEPNLAFADPDGRIVTAGGTTSWHDLALHIIARHASPGDALRIAKAYLLKLHGEGQLPYRSLSRGSTHEDAAVGACQDRIERGYRSSRALADAIGQCGMPERTLKRRFKAATGVTPIQYLQNFRIEEAKRLLESGPDAIDEIGYAVGYDDPSFFRRLFKRLVGLTPGQYRRMFRTVTATARALPPGDAVS